MHYREVPVTCLSQWIDSKISWNYVSKRISTDDGIPRDSTLVREVEVLIPFHLYVLMSCLAGFGIVMAVSLFIFNVIYKDNV